MRKKKTKTEFQKYKSIFAKLENKLNKTKIITGETKNENRIVKN